MSDETSSPKRRVPRGSAGRARRPAVNAHVRLSGLVRIGPRYAMLETDDGTLWRLRSDEDLQPHADRRTTVEARVSAADELALLWIGPDSVADDETKAV
ncbi:hypothetical protein HZF05_14285 [Sphingomonas sp. CGMCC 1.13654]|uniref:Uncharacterized protein n=1 Tax=Sphingomonas chungangi TaxID=2683589 RepID=A0A838L6Z1_9SPHN|nr:DUF5818 domain-containing protein [Sphingomonas chungangi]MBA2935253.1 hypothetical protein [Sphingomonas chungangi]MVW55332.1 hypothetical protein [Sphingomonas chungangi]